MSIYTVYTMKRHSETFSIKFLSSLLKEANPNSNFLENYQGTPEVKTYLKKVENDTLKTCNDAFNLVTDGKHTRN